MQADSRLQSLTGPCAGSRTRAPAACIKGAATCSDKLPAYAVQAAHLQGFAQAHLVGQDAVEAVVVQGHQPLQAHHLVVPQCSAGGAEQQLGRLCDLLLYRMRQCIVPARIFRFSVTLTKIISLWSVGSSVQCGGQSSSFRASVTCSFTACPSA